VFLAACAALTKNIRVGHGIRQVIANYNHPARTAEGLGTLDIVSNGRLDFGIGEGATRLELGGFAIPAREKRAMALEAAEQIANMMAMTPYPGYEGKSFSFPCRNIVPKPVQKPHPPIWMACTNRETIKIAAQNGIGALAFSFVDPGEAKTWADIYYGIIKSESCVPLGHAVNANIAMVSNFSVHRDRAEAIRRGQEGFEFFSYAINALVAHDAVPGRSTLYADFLKSRARQDDEIIAATRGAARNANGIGTPDDIAAHIEGFQAAGIDQVIFLQQAGRNRHQHIRESLELFASAVMPRFKAQVAAREAKKAAELAPYIAAAMARKKWMAPLADDQIPVVRASVQKAQINS
jgi:alkanesulfonate monooxygenase SsuD/methylene tetrahydromethanopterin reductase-like flavin-dependent oxidoreductase (luciferase family)